VSGCWSGAVSRPCAERVWCLVYTYGFVDESDAGQILTVEELRALRDRMGVEAAAARQVRGAAPSEVAASPAVIPLEARAEVREVLRHLAIQRQRWSRRLAVVGCLALAGGAVSVLVITASTRSDPGSAGEVFVPVFPAPVVSVPPMTTSFAPEPVFPTEAPVVPIVTAPGGSAKNTTKLPAATVHPPRSSYRSAPSRPSVAPSDGRPPPTVVNLDEPPSAPSVAPSDGRPPPTVVNLDERRRGQR
jgi:hypothetical protein